MDLTNYYDWRHGDKPYGQVQTRVTCPLCGDHCSCGSTLEKIPQGSPGRIAQVHEGETAMDVSKVNEAINNTHAELNAVIDGAVKSRNVQGLRSLTLAAQNLETAEKHLARAVVQSTPKAAK